MREYSSIFAIPRILTGISITGMAIALAVAPAVGKDTIKLGIGEMAIWDSNPGMLTRDESNIWGSETKAFLEMARKTENEQLNANFYAIRNQFNKSAFNSTDFLFRTNLKKKSHLWEGTLGGTIDYDTTRTGEITTFGRNLGGAQKRFTWQIEPGIAYAISPRSKVALNGSWEEKFYDSIFLTDYRTVSLSPSFAYSITPLQTAVLSFQAQRYISLNDGNQTVDSLGPSLGWQYHFRPEFSLELSVGFMGSKYDGYTSFDEDWEVNPIYAGTLEYYGQRNQAALNISRARQSYGNGTESELTTVALENKFIIDPRWYLDIKGSYQMAKQPPVSTSNLDTAWEESIALSYKTTDRWRLSLSQKYRRENLTGAQGEADRNIVHFALTYRFGSLN